MYLHPTGIIMHLLSAGHSVWKWLIRLCDVVCHEEEENGRGDMIIGKRLVYGRGMCHAEMLETSSRNRIMLGEQKAGS